MSQEKRPTAEQMAKFKKNSQDQSLSAEIRAKFQAIVDKFAEDVEGGDEPKKRGRKPSTIKKYKTLPKPKMVALITATTQAEEDMKAQLKKLGYNPEEVDALDGNKAFAILEELKSKMVGKPKRTATPRATKKTITDVEQAKAEIKAKTGKTEAECEAIIEQYRALRTKAQEGKRKAEQASATNKKRVEKLDQKGDLIEGTNVKTADAVIESTTKDVAEKIEQQIEAVEEKAEKEAKAEVAKDKTIKTTTEKKEAVEAKVEKKVKEKTKTIVKRVVIDTSALLTSIADSLGKFDKDSQKEFLIKLRSDIDKLLAKYAFGGMTDGATQVMNVQQSNLSASSVNPTMFANGGGVDGGAKIRIDSVDIDVYEDSYEEGEGIKVNSYSRNELVGKLVSPKELVSFLSDELYIENYRYNYSIMDGAIFTSKIVDEDSDRPSEYQKEQWKKGDLVLYSENIRIGVSIIHPTEITDEELSELTGIGLYEKGGKVKMSSKYAKGGGVDKLPANLKKRLENVKNRYGVEISKEEAIEAYKYNLDGAGGSTIGYEYFGADTHRQSTTLGDLAIDLGRFYSGKSIGYRKGDDKEFYADGGGVKKSSGLNYGKKDDVYFDVVTLLNSKMQKPKGIFGQEKVQVKTMSLDSLMEYVKNYENDIRYDVDLPIELFTKESFHKYSDEGIKFKFINGKIYRLGKEELLEKKIDSYTKERGIKPSQRVLAKFEKEVQDAPQKTTIVQRIHSQQLLANGGVIGQEIVFDDNGSENSGVIKDITNLGDYVVKADDGRTLLAQRDLDVISFGAMRQQGVEQRKKRFGFFDEGGNVSDVEYDDILAVLEDKLTEAVANDISNSFENSYNANGEEVEHQSRDGFIAFTDGGFEVRWFEYLSGFYGSGYSLPTSALDKEKSRQIDLSLEDAKDYFKDEYPEIVEELGEENIDYNSLYEAGYESEAEDLSNVEMDMMDGTIMCEIGAYYYTPNNDRGIEGEHTLRLFGLVNLESPYHRSGNLEDRYDIDITFDSIEELEEKVDAGLKEITKWFNGSNYDESTKELRIVRMAKGGGVEGKLSYEEFVETLRDDDKINTYTGKTTTGMKMYYLPQGHPFLNMKFSHKNKRKAYNEYLSVANKKGFAKGGLTEHGLRVGDTIIEDFGDDEIGVRSSNRDFHRINLDKGKRFSKGGNVSSMLRNRRGQ